MADSFGGHGDSEDHVGGPHLGRGTGGDEGGRRTGADPLTDDSVGIGLLDTSVLIAAEEGRSLRAEALPKRAAISIITLGELRAGILAAPDIQSRDRRLYTLERISGTTILPVDHRVAQTWAGMRAYLAASGKRVSGNDVWIAATAATSELPVVTQDRDFNALSGVNGLTVIEI